jgi:hypothetical protein
MRSASGAEAKPYSKRRLDIIVSDLLDFLGFAEKVERLPAANTFDN